VGRPTAVSLPPPKQQPHRRTAGRSPPPQHRSVSRHRLLASRNLSGSHVVRTLMIVLCPHHQTTARRSTDAPPQQQRLPAPHETVAFFGSPSEHSLRGRNIQDCRARIEARRVRIYRSELLRFLTTETIARRRPPALYRSGTSRPAIDNDAHRRALHARRTSKTLDSSVVIDLDRIHDRRMLFSRPTPALTYIAKTFRAPRTTSLTRHTANNCMRGLNSAPLTGFFSTVNSATCTYTYAYV
jgi:hypothetical protein